MKRRARRAVIGAAALVALVVAVLVVANWTTVRDHIEVWRFQVTRETATIEPMAADVTVYASWWEVLLHDAADDSRSSVIFDSQEEFPLLSQLVYRRAPEPSRYRGRAGAYAGEIIAFFQKNGYRIIKQRLPRRAYVVVRDPPAARSSAPLWSSEGADAGISLEITPTISPGTKRP